MTNREKALLLTSKFGDSKKPVKLTAGQVGEVDASTRSKRFKNNLK